VLQFLSTCRGSRCSHAYAAHPHWGTMGSVGTPIVPNTTRPECVPHDKFALAVENRSGRLSGSGSASQSADRDAAFSHSLPYTRSCLKKELAVRSSVVAIRRSVAVNEPKPPHHAPAAA
jgi:hypothetical protein